MDRLAALDIGGTKIAAGVVTRDGAIVASERIPTRATATAQELLGDVVGVLRRLPAVDGGLGVGCGGPMTRRHVSPLNIPAWRQFPLGDELADRFPDWTVVVDNDAKAFALAEGRYGAARGVADFMGVVVSTGVGGGIVLDGRLLHGEDGNAGHVGHVMAVPEGAECACGARGCVEAEASGSTIARRAAQRCRDGEISSGALFARWREGAEAAGEGVATTTSTVDGISAVDVLEAARGGDAPALHILAEAGRALGRGIADTANLLDLRLAVVGGGVALAAGELLFGPLREEAARRARLDHSRSLRIVTPELREAGLVGAAALWWDAARD